MEQIRPLLPGRQRRLAAGRIRGANSRGDREAVASRMKRLSSSTLAAPRQHLAGFGTCRPRDRLETLFGRRDLSQDLGVRGRQSQLAVVEGSEYLA